VLKFLLLRQFIVTTRGQRGQSFLHCRRASGKLLSQWKCLWWSLTCRVEICHYKERWHDIWLWQQYFKHFIRGESGTHEVLWKLLASQGAVF